MEPLLLLVYLVAALTAARHGVATKESATASDALNPNPDSSPAGRLMCHEYSPVAMHWSDMDALQKLRDGTTVDEDPVVHPDGPHIDISTEEQLREHHDTSLDPVFQRALRLLGR